MCNDFLNDPDVPELFSTLKGLLDKVNVEDKGCTERVYKGLRSDLAAPATSATSNARTMILRHT